MAETCCLTSGRCGTDVSALRMIAGCLPVTGIILSAANIGSLVIKPSPTGEDAKSPGAHEKLMKTRVLNAKCGVIGSVLTLAGLIALLVFGIFTGPLVLPAMILTVAFIVMNGVIIQLLKGTNKPPQA